MIRKRAARCGGLTVNACVLFVVLSMCGALLAACAAAPTEPVATSMTAGAFAGQGGAAVEPAIGTRQLRLVVMPTDSAVGEIAQAHLTTR